MLFLTALVWAAPGVHVSRETLHHLTILRLCRLVTRLRDVERFQLIVRCVAMIVPASIGVVGILYCAGAVWSALGVQLFGGLVYDGNPDLEGTDYLDSHYDARTRADVFFSPRRASRKTERQYSTVAAQNSSRIDA